MLSRRTLVAALALGGAAALGWPAIAQEIKTVAVTAIVEHPALDAARNGIRDELAAAGYEEGHNLDFLFESAQGNPATAAQIARKFVGEAPDVIVPISTPSAQAVVGATKEIPVVFTAVTDPVGAKLVANLERPGGNVTGNVDAIYVPTDNTVVTALEAVVRVGTDNQLPVFAGDTDSVPRGAIAALGFNYYDLGRQTGKIVARVLEGANPGDIPVEGVQITELYVNPAAAEAMGVTIPPELLERARFVVD